MTSAPQYPTPCTPHGGYIHRVFLTRSWRKVVDIDASVANGFEVSWAEFWTEHYTVFSIGGCR